MLDLVPDAVPTSMADPVPKHAPQIDSLLLDSLQVESLPEICFAPIRRAASWSVP